MVKRNKSKYYLFIDECGDHNLAKYDPGFPVFTLCGILVSKYNLRSLSKAFEDLKIEIFGTKEVVIHSIDIRKWRGSFSILSDQNLRERFFTGIAWTKGNTSLNKKEPSCNSSFRPGRTDP